MHFFVVAAIAVCAFFVGVWLAPLVRADYAEFKTYAESKLKLNEQRAKDKALNVINKL